jgi:hypothetical protein
VTQALAGLEISWLAARRPTGQESRIRRRGWRLDDIAVRGIANTPFAAFVAEPTKYIAGVSAIAGDSGVVRVRSATGSTTLPPPPARRGPPPTSPE